MSETLSSADNPRAPAALNISSQKVLQISWKQFRRATHQEKADGTGKAKVPSELPIAPRDPAIDRGRNLLSNLLPGNHIRALEKPTSQTQPISAAFSS